MANIFEMLKSQKEKGFDLIDTNGNFIKSDKVKKEAYKAYNKGVQTGEIEPLEYDFKSYFDWFTGENFAEVETIEDAITEALVDNEEIGESDLAEQESTEQEG